MGAKLAAVLEVVVEEASRGFFYNADSCPRSVKGNSLARWSHSADSSCWEDMVAFWHLILFCPSGSFRTRVEES